MSNLSKKQPEGRRHTNDSKKNQRVPSLRLHKASRQMYTVLSGRAIYCGKPDNPATEQRYHQIIAEWFAAGKHPPVESGGITVKEILSRFWVHAIGYYRTKTDGRVKELEQFRLAIKPLKELYGESLATDFGPRAMKTVRQKMIDQGWCRPYVNKQINRIRHIFKWAASDELIPGQTLLALQAVSGLRKGRSAAREPDPIKPVPIDHVNAIEPFVSPQVWAMIQLQLFTAARAGELCQMRPCDIDRTSGVWVYRPEKHKTAHHGFDRKIFIGPRGQEVLSPFLLRNSKAYCFSPAQAETERRQKEHASRITPLSCGNTPGSNIKENPMKSDGDRYTTDSYRRAIQRACDQAFPPPEPLAKRDDETWTQYDRRLTKKQQAEIAAWQKAHRWHPHQLRHNAATELRKEFGLEAARIILGHHSTAITEVYAEKDEQQAIEAMGKVG